MEEFSKRFLEGRIRYRTEVLNIKPLPKVPCDELGSRIWSVSVEDLTTHQRKTLEYDKIVLCTGVSCGHMLGGETHRKQSILTGVQPGSNSSRFVAGGRCRTWVSRPGHTLFRIRPSSRGDTASCETGL